MVALALNTGLIPLAARPARAQKRVAARAAVVPKAAFNAPKVAQTVRKAAAAVPVVAAAPAFAAQNAVEQVALADVNILGVIATALFIIIPTSFLIVLFVKSQSEENVSGGFSQKYYDESKKAGNKKTNEAARLKGAGIGMRPSK